MDEFGAALPRYTGALTLALAGLCAAAVAQPAPFPSEEVSVMVDSGWVWADADANAARAGEAQVVFSHVLAVEGAAWLQLQFDELALVGSRDAGNAAILRVTSLRDLANQRLDHASAAQWNGRSAFFNGGAVLIEVLAHPSANDEASRVAISTVTAGLPPQPAEGGIASICFGVDEREPSNDPRDARTSNGCTAFLIGHYCLLTAGHCGGASSIEFNVPLSEPDGSINFAHPDDQYVIDPNSKQVQNAPCSNDWAYFGVFPNSNTGLTPLQAQGSTYQLATAAPEAEGQLIRIRGYGTTASPVPHAWNKVQKEHSGPLVAINSTHILHQADTTSGNSGSAVYDLGTGLVIGVHTCGGCTGNIAANQATAIDHANLQAALADPKGVCTWDPPADSCTGDFNGDGKVDVADLLIMLSKWGVCIGCPEDLTGNDRVQVPDLLILLSLWGECPDR